MIFKDQSLESTRPGNGRSKARKREHQGLEFLKWALISQKAWHNEAGVSMVLVIVLSCLLCCSNEWSEAGEGLGNLQELMLEKKKKAKYTLLFTSLPQQPLQDVNGILVCTRCYLESFRSSPNWGTFGLCGSAGWVSSVDRRATGLIPDQGTCLGCGFSSSRDMCETQPINVSLPHRCISPSLSLHSPLSKINKHVLGWGFKKKKKDKPLRKTVWQHLPSTKHNPF